MTLPISNGVTAPCGPECRHAAPLARGAGGEWVWCALRGEPRTIGAEAEECSYFAAPPELAGSPPRAAVLYSGRSATDQLPHEN